MSAKGRKPKTADTGAEFYPTEPPWRVEAGEGWTLHLASYLDGLPLLDDKSVTVTITDPPYEAEAHTDGRRQKGKTTTGAFREVLDSALPFAAIADLDRQAVADQIARVTQYRALAFCQAEAVSEWRDAFNASGITYRRAMPWVKPDAMPSLHGRWPGQSYESIVLAMFPSAPSCPVGGASRRYEFTRDAALYRRHGEKKTGEAAPHPTMKPLDLMLQLVEDFTEPGDLVLDPFAGSGTTGVACLSLGRRFIGWEIDEAYFEVACRRLRGERAVPRPEQPDLFAGVAS